MKTKFKKTLAAVLCCAVLFCGNVFATDAPKDYEHNHQHSQEVSARALSQCPNCAGFLKNTSAVVDRRCKYVGGKLVCEKKVSTTFYCSSCPFKYTTDEWVME